jgi:hypothetical protein
LSNSEKDRDFLLATVDDPITNLEKWRICYIRRSVSFAKLTVDLTSTAHQQSNHICPFFFTELLMRRRLWIYRRFDCDSFLLEYIPNGLLWKKIQFFSLPPMRIFRSLAYQALPVHAFIILDPALNWCNHQEENNFDSFMEWPFSSFAPC